MRIDKDVKSNMLNTLAKAAQTKPSKETTAGTQQNVGASDKVELSGRNKEIVKLIAKVNEASSIRQDKVDAIRQEIQNGTYNVSGEQVARGIIKNSILDQIY